MSERRLCCPQVLSASGLSMIWSLILQIFFRLVRYCFPANAHDLLIIGLLYLIL